MSIDIHGLIGETLREAAEELKNGNPKGHEYLATILDGAVSLSDESDILVLHSSISSISQKFFDSQTKLPGGSEFMKAIGDVYVKMSGAIASRDSAGISDLIRVYIAKIRERWKDSLRLKEEEK
mgnify:CR=1 FL=1